MIPIKFCVTPHHDDETDNHNPQNDWRKSKIFSSQPYINKIVYDCVSWFDCWHTNTRCIYIYIYIHIWNKNLKPIHIQHTYMRMTGVRLYQTGYQTLTKHKRSRLNYDWTTRKRNMNSIRCHSNFFTNQSFSVTFSRHVTGLLQVPVAADPNCYRISITSFPSRCNTD